ncbi:MAG: 50S ribosomal protein L22 [Candidatus Saganbacteria bacterium]|nr:50S ribosomal protein L22 [Candidatus Saganbacteria bacterium]
MTKVSAKVKWVRIAPRKLSRVVALVRGKLALEALDLLKFMPQKGARILEKVIKSAVANAKNNYKLTESTLVVCEAYVNKGITMRRWQARARGRVFPINKRTSHLTVWVSQSEKIKNPPKSRQESGRRKKEAA